MPMVLRSLPGLGVAVGALIILASCGGTPARGGPPSLAGQAATVATTRAVAQEIKATLTYPGTINAVNQVNLVARTAGVITAFPFQVGQTVQQGDVIARLDDSTQQAQLQQAEASLGPYAS